MGGHKMYEPTVGSPFRHQVDWSQIYKAYALPVDLGKYSPRVWTGAKEVPPSG